MEACSTRTSRQIYYMLSPNSYYRGPLEKPLKPSAQNLWTDTSSCTAGQLICRPKGQAKSGRASRYHRDASLPHGQGDGFRDPIGMPSNNMDQGIQFSSSASHFLNKIKHGFTDQNNTIILTLRVQPSKEGRIPKS